MVRPNNSVEVLTHNQQVVEATPDSVDVFEQLDGMSSLFNGSYNSEEGDGLRRNENQDHSPWFMDVDSPNSDDDYGEMPGLLSESEDSNDDQNRGTTMAGDDFSVVQSPLLFPTATFTSEESMSHSHPTFLALSTEYGIGRDCRYYLWQYVRKGRGHQ